MRRGEIRIVDFDPALGSEAARRRPAVIVSNDAANAGAGITGRGVVVVVPLTFNTDKILPFQVLAEAADTGLPSDSKVQAEHVRSVSVQRVGRPIGVLPFELMERLDDALRLHLDL
ncbi:type II toxin-antitoxin system PemK/MazF family toxin [Candidatus Poriferisodalis sp.]|uniref:type II toxin-antitoxin system PemK/MazF family toxin n=1 Tax=Candidatus Poriferisodalis sp. TaxID=3101277 RepID=UPI003B51ED2C